jgi:hypothetical protein
MPPTITKISPPHAHIVNKPPGALNNSPRPPRSAVGDRAVELFWQIKGGRVDYGARHAARHGHARFGRTFPGLYPRWDAAHPVHLIGHSMGGQTARMLVQMLRDQVPPLQQRRTWVPRTWIVAGGGEGGAVAGQCTVRETSPAGASLPRTRFLANRA